MTPTPEPRTEAGKLNEAWHRLYGIAGTMAQINARDGSAIPPHPFVWHDLDQVLDEIGALLNAGAEAAHPESDPRLIDTSPKLGGLSDLIELELGQHNPGANWECDCGDQVEGETFNHHVAVAVDYRLTATDGDA